MNTYEKWLNTQDFRPGHNPEHAAERAWNAALEAVRKKLDEECEQDSEKPYIHVINDLHSTKE